ncbi:anaerobic glycerol-3-phosphate dehydrogenase [Nocardia sp. GAS34]
MIHSWGGGVAGVVAGIRTRVRGFVCSIVTVA